MLLLFFPYTSSGAAAIERLSGSISFTVNCLFMSMEASQAHSLENILLGENPVGAENISIIERIQKYQLLSNCLFRHQLVQWICIPN